MRAMPIGALLGVLGAVACEPAPEPFESDVFWIEITETSEPCAGIEITENMTNAAPSPSQTAAVETTTSIPGDYAAVTLGEEGTAFVNYQGSVLVGTANPDGSLEASFLNEESLNETRTSETYTHTRIEELAFEQTLSLVPTGGEENPRFTGSFTVRDSFLLDVSENDEWDPDVVGTGATQMPETDDYLVWTEPTQGGVINQEFRDDCPEDVCSMRVFSECTRSYEVSAVRLEGADVEAFEILENFDQPEGVL